MARAPSEYEERLARAGAQLEKLVRRLQGLSASAWMSRHDSVVAALTRLVELDGIVEARVMPRLPELASFALADAIGVVGGDVLAALRDSPDVAALTNVETVLTDVLSVTR